MVPTRNIVRSIERGQLKRRPLFPPCLTPPRGKCGGMKIHTEYLTLHTKTKRAYVHLTPQVEAALKKAGIKDGMILVSAMHITAGVYVNDNEGGLIKDIDQWLETLAPLRQDYQHHQTGENNGDAHLKSLIIHHEVIVPVTNGKLDFGPWQQIFYAEFDGQRDKRVIIKVMGE
jgi:secondary thiamine-phosphate synthase enzyme